jgi:betaine-aldehyde dehydrogenase
VRLIAPWNYRSSGLWKIAPIIAAGDTMVVKPAQFRPLTTIKLVALLAGRRRPASWPGLSRAAGQGGPGRSRDVDLVSFTGGLVAGRSIARRRGNVKKIALELGGKSPNIVFADADVETAVDYALTAAFLHSGQVCSAGCRLIVEDSIHDAFVAEVGRRAERIRLGNGFDEASETGPLITAEHRAKVEAYVALGIEEGARLVAGGRRPEEPELQSGFFYRPTLPTAGPRCGSSRRRSSVPC